MMTKNRFGKFTGLTLSLLLLIGTTLPALPVFLTTEAAIAQTPTKRKRIMIVDFDFASTSDSSYWYSYRGGAARGISELLTNKLVNDGTYIVTSRSAVENYLRENNISGPVNEATAVKVAKALGVDAVLVGTVTRFNVESKSGGGGLFGIGASSQTTKAVVQLTTRLVDPKTQDIIGAMEGLGESGKSSTSVSVFGIGGSGGSTGTDEILSQAADDAVTKVVTQLKTRL